MRDRLPNPASPSYQADQLQKKLLTNAKPEVAFNCLTFEIGDFVRQCAAVLLPRVRAIMRRMIAVNCRKRAVCPEKCRAALRPCDQPACASFILATYPTREDDNEPKT